MSSYLAHTGIVNHSLQVDSTWYR